VGNKNCFSGTL